MDCRETETLLAAFHDGELSADDRARVEAHLAGCPACRALLEGLAQADEAAGVPDPGADYWDGFNARVMDRIGKTDAIRETPAPDAVVLRPKQGWARQQFRYLVPALAAAALVVVVVRYAGMEPGTPAPPGAGPSVMRTSEQPSPAQPSEQPSIPRNPPDGRPTSGLTARRADADQVAGRKDENAETPAYPSEAKATPAPLAAASIEAEPSVRTAAPPPSAAPEIGRLASAPPPPAPVFADGRAGGIASEESVRGADRAAAGKLQAATPEPSAEGAASLQAPSAMRWAAKAESAAKSLSAKERSASPCELARRFAAQGRLKEAESAQRDCLKQAQAPAAQEDGLVFLAELLDRQARFAEADAVILQAQRQFPASRPLDRYMQQRPMVQKLQQSPVR